MAFRTVVPLIALAFLSSCGEKKPVEVVQASEGVVIRFLEDKSDLPVDWRVSYPRPRVEPVPGTQRTQAVRTIEKTLKAYPSGFVREHIASVSVFYRMTIGGDEYGGTYELPRDLYVFFDSTYDEYWIITSLHHEISSLLFHRYADEVRLAGLTYWPIYEEYPDDVNESLDRDVALRKRGFLNPYASTSPEEDFNEIAAALMSGDSEAWRDAKEFEKLGAKFDKVMNFYSLVDKRFTRKFFEELVEP